MNLHLLRDLLRQKKPLPKLISLSAFPCLTVHPSSAWPAVGGKVVTRLPADKDFHGHTTQSFVSGEVVAKKVRDLLQGKKLVVQAIFRDDGTTWIFNGHHTLAAYSLLGRVPLIELYDPSAGRRLGAPRFVDQCGRPVVIVKRSATKAKPHAASAKRPAP